MQLQTQRRRRRQSQRQANPTKDGGDTNVHYQQEQQYSNSYCSATQQQQQQQQQDTTITTMIRFPIIGLLVVLIFLLYWNSEAFQQHQQLQRIVFLRKQQHSLLSSSSSSSSSPPLVIYDASRSNLLFFSSTTTTTNNNILSFPTTNHPKVAPVKQNDIGGWYHPQMVFHPASLPLDISSRSKTPDYGSILYAPVAQDHHNKQHQDVSQQQSKQQQQPPALPRLISNTDFDDFEDYRNDVLSHDNRLRPYYWHKQELEAQEEDCRLPNWSDQYHPTCTIFHEFAMATMSNLDIHSVLGNDETMEYQRVSHGFFRDVWLVHHYDSVSSAPSTTTNTSIASTTTTTTALKTLRWSQGDRTIQKSLRTVLQDALIMEQLTKSPRIVDMYGHCGTSLWVEAIAEEVQDFVVPGTGYIEQSKLHDQDDVRPRNNFTNLEKLDMALQMAESLADLHGFDGGVIVHDDVQLCQWLRLPNGNIKLGDFNRAEIMAFNSKTQEYCKYSNGECYGNYRAPEEFAQGKLNEAIDVFSFGNNIYALLTGLWVFYEITDDEEVHEELIHGRLAFVDPRYKTRSYIEGKLVEVMEQCWEYDPDKRISIFEAVRFLREVKRKVTRHSQLLLQSGDREPTQTRKLS